MRLTLEDNYRKVSSGPVNTWAHVSRSVSWDSYTSGSSLINDLPMIFEYLKQYQECQKIRARSVFEWDRRIPQAKIEHIDKLLKKYRPLYTKAWEWDDSL